jgi:hypothetical protein
MNNRLAHRIAAPFLLLTVTLASMLSASGQRVGEPLQEVKAPKQASEVKEEAVSLEVGKPIVRDMKGGETRVHRLYADRQPLPARGSRTVQVDPTPYDWGVAYYMPYDNNLVGYGNRIIKMIRDGVISDRTVAAVQADFPDPGGMHRFIIRSSEMQETRIASDDSASEDRLIEYLAWFVRLFRCKRYIVVLLDHGGRLDEMCLDERPDTPGKHWMSGHVLGQKLRDFNRTIEGRLELLFLQQCSRGTIENLYSFRGTANFIMSSSEAVGAPNTYYTALQEWLSEEPDATGEMVAGKISSEDDDYTMYTCVRTSMLARLPERLNALIKTFLRKDRLSPPEHPQMLYSVSGPEPVVDLRAYLDRLTEANHLDPVNVEEFFRWVHSELFARVWFHKGKEGMAHRMCGLAIYVPGDAVEAGRYSYLDIYRDSLLSALWKNLTQPRPKRLAPVIAP